MKARRMARRENRKRGWEIDLGAGHTSPGSVGADGGVRLVFWFPFLVIITLFIKVTSRYVIYLD
jgi:hypothetical protein